MSRKRWRSFRRAVNIRGVPRKDKRAPIVLPPGAGRAYAMGPVQAVFKADGDSFGGGVSIDEDEIFLD